MNEAPEQQALPPGLRLLKGLVIVLMITLIVGVITVVGVIVTRMPQALARGPVLPDALRLPEGAQATAVTTGEGWFAVVTTDQRLLIYGSDGILRREIVIGSEKVD